jgi:hypothetical protein
MNEIFNPQPTAEQAPSPIDQLWTYIMKSPDHHGIRGQVQIKLPGNDVYQDSALFEPKLNGSVLTFGAANKAGEIITYTSKDDSAEVFLNTSNGQEYEVVFPGFNLEE